MICVFDTLCGRPRSIADHLTGWNGSARLRFCLSVLAAFALTLLNFSAQAQQQFNTFKSVLSNESASWCMAIGGGQYQVTDALPGEEAHRNAE